MGSVKDLWTSIRFERTSGICRVRAFWFTRLSLPTAEKIEQWLVFNAQSTVTVMWGWPTTEKKSKEDQILNNNNRHTKGSKECVFITTQTHSLHYQLSWLDMQIWCLTLFDFSEHLLNADWLGQQLFQVSDQNTFALWTELKGSQPAAPDEQRSPPPQSLTQWMHSLKTQSTRWTEHGSAIRLKISISHWIIIMNWYDNCIEFCTASYEFSELN